MDDKNFIEKEVVLTIRVPEDFDHEDESMLDDEFANILEKQGWELAKSEEYRDANEEKQVYVLTGTRQKDDLFDLRVIGVSENPKVLQELMFQRIETDEKSFTLIPGGQDVKLPFDLDLGKAVYGCEYEEGFISYDISRFPLIPSLALEKETEKSINENAIDCIYISVWDDGVEVSSNAKFDPISQTVFDIETADLPVGVLENLDICTGEYVEINGKRFLLEESNDGTYTFAENLLSNKKQTKSVDKLIADANMREKNNSNNIEEKSIYHERF